MKRREIIKYLSILPLSGTAVVGATSKLIAKEEILTPKATIVKEGSVKRIAAIITEYRPNSHADVIIGKYLEGYNQDEKPPYPKSKIVSIFTEQVPSNDMSRDLSKKYNVPIFRTVADALTLGGDSF